MRWHRLYIVRDVYTVYCIHCVHIKTSATDILVKEIKIYAKCVCVCGHYDSASARRSVAAAATATAPTFQNNIISRIYSTYLIS